MTDIDEIDEDCIRAELLRRWQIDEHGFTSEEHQLFRKLYREEYDTHYVNGTDWEPEELKDSERAYRYRRWVEEFIGMGNALSWQYGNDYQAKVTEILKGWDSAGVAKLLRVPEEEAAKRLEIAMSDRWKER